MSLKEKLSWFRGKLRLHEQLSSIKNLMSRCRDIMPSLLAVLRFALAGLLVWQIGVPLAMSLSESARFAELAKQLPPTTWTVTQPIPDRPSETGMTNAASAGVSAVETSRQTYESFSPRVWAWGISMVGQAILLGLLIWAVVLIVKEP